jgi:hypothetical protein
MRLSVLDEKKDQSSPAKTESELTQPRGGKVDCNPMKKVTPGNTALDGRRDAHG